MYNQKGAGLRDWLKLENFSSKGVLIAIFVIVAIVVLYFVFKRRGSPESFDSESGIEETNGSDASQENAAKQSTGKVDKTNEIVLYYATWCGYSKQFLPEWEKFVEYAKHNMPQLKVTGMRCEDGNEAICMQKGVEGYPMVILYMWDGREVTFKGDRTKEALVTFVSNNI
jgi:thioredoxin-like negative regulator of GroEL